ncbi:MAG: hypothetical protein U0X93_01825 [Anaerolineales bacterium]
MSNKKYLIFLFIVAFAGAALAALVTSKYGPGVSADGTKYLSIAQNLLDGKGFFDHTGRPLLWWPPLYPLEIAGMSRLTGLDVLFAAGWLNIITLAVNIFLNGALVYYAFPDKPLRQYLSALFILASDMAIRIHANISSEPLFVTFSMIFLFASADYVQTRSRRALWWMIAMSALAPLQRYLGASLIAAGGCFILFAHRRDIWRGVREGFVFGMLSLLPIAAWIWFHNIGQYDSFWGVSGSIVDPLENLRLSLAKILHWFLPYHPLLQPLFDNPWIVVGTHCGDPFADQQKRKLENFRADDDATHPARLVGVLRVDDPRVDVFRHHRRSRGFVFGSLLRWLAFACASDDIRRF